MRQMSKPSKQEEMAASESLKDAVSKVPLRAARSPSYLKHSEHKHALFSPSLKDAVIRVDFGKEFKASKFVAKDPSPTPELD